MSDQTGTDKDAFAFRLTYGENGSDVNVEIGERLADYDADTQVSTIGRILTMLAARFLQSDGYVVPKLADAEGSEEGDDQ